MVNHMQHTNPFSPTGYDIQDLRSRIDRKADQHEISSLRSDVAALERANGEIRSEIDGLRTRCERMAEVLRELNPGIASVDGY